ncbi:putative surface anchored protein, partial [Pseudogracilibacillus auburnensis]
MKRGIGLLFAFVLVLQTIFTSLGLGSIVTAQGNEQSIFKNFAVVDEDGNEVNLEEVDGDSAVFIHIEWSTKGVEITAEDSESLTLVEELHIKKEQLGELIFDHTEVGTYQAIDDTVTVTFNKEIGKLENANGTFTVEAIIKESTEVEQENEQNESLKEKADTAGKEDAELEETDLKEEVSKEDAEATDKKRKNTQAAPMKQNITSENAGFKLEIGKVTDFDGKEYAEDYKLNPKDEFSLVVDWHLENGHPYNAGDTVEFDLPKQIYLDEDMTDGELMDGDNNLIANYVITTDNKVKLTFTNYVDTHSNVKGYIGIAAKLNPNEVEVKDGEVTIDPIDEGRAIVVPVNPVDNDKTIGKSGKPAKDYNAEEISWTVTANENGSNLTDAKIVDELPEGLEYIADSIKVTKYKTNLIGEVVGEGEDVTVSIAPEINGQKLTIPLGDTKDKYVVEYTTKITDMSIKSFKNDATLIDENKEDQKASATVPINRGEPINKSAVTDYDPKTGIIEWEIEFNFDQKSLENVTLSDKWEPAGKVVLEGDVEFFEVTIDENGEPINEVPANIGTLNEITDGFEVTGITTDKAYKVKYKTKVIDRVIDGFTMENVASFGQHSTKKSTEIGQYYGVKWAGAVNYKEKTIDWTIHLNRDEHPMKDIKITDTLTEGQTLKQNSVKVKVGGQEYTGHTVTGENESTFEVKFPEDYETSEEIIIEYKSDYDPNTVGSNPKNTATIEWIPENSGEVIKKDLTVGTKINEKNENNHWKNGTYNPDTKKITWELIVNYRGNAYDELVIKDTPKGNQKLVTDSIKVEELEVPSNGNEYKIADVPVDDSNLTASEDGFTLNLGDTDKTYKVIYETTIDHVEHLDEMYENDVEVSDGTGEADKVSSSVTIPKANEYSSKKGKEVGKTVEWSIDINPGQHKVTGLTLTDTISDNHAYLQDTIRVYEATVDKDGKAIKGEPYSTDLYELNHEADTQTFEIKWKEEIDRAFVVEYSTIFFAQKGEEVTNDYKVTGENLKDGASQGGKESIIIDRYSSSGGTGEVGFLIVDKVDKEGKKLAGAKFELRDKETDQLLISGVTDEDGQISFGRLMYGDYLLIETETPDGYVAHTDEHTITINKPYTADSDKTKFAYSVENYVPIFAIDLSKTDNEGNVLAGAEFTLFDSEDKEVAKGTTNEDGKILFEDLEDAGTYYVQETKAPAGFILDSTKYPVTIGDKEPEPVKVSLENTPRGAVLLTKIDVDTNETLAGVEFELQKLNDEGEYVKVDSFTTNEHGNIKTSNTLEAGDYQFVETKALDGYRINEEPIQFEVELDETRTLTYVMTNEKFKGSIKLIKSDAATNDLLSNAEFKLIDSEGEVVKENLVTNDQGEIVIEDLLLGTYQLIETKAPAGYELDETPIDIEITEDLQTVEKAMKNNKITDISVEKKWNNADGETTPVTVKLLPTDQTVELNEENAWKATFKDLRVYDESGEEIDYQVEEMDVDGYKSTVTGDAADGFIVTNTEITSISGTKTWLDDESEERPEAITVKLLANGDVVKTTQVNEATDWKYEFTDLVKYDESGNEITYSIDEVAVDGYETTIDDYDITNLRIGKTEVTGTKTWLDDDSESRPASITVYLLANGEQIDEVDVTKESDWKYEFTELPKYDEQGKEIEYTVDEKAVNGYEKSIEGHDITNLRVGKTEVDITKLWKDEQETDRPGAITVNLLQNGIVYDEYEVTKENDWNLTITDLPEYDEAGKAYKYTVTEHDVPGYTSNSDGFEITNTRTDVKTIEITKSWLDDDSEDRPDSIEVELLRAITEGDKELVETYTISADQEWTLKVKDLPAFDVDGKAYTYEIKEKPVKGYETEVNGFDLTNLRVGETEVTGTKTWLDDDSESRPASITVYLLANGEQIDEVDVTEESNWEYEFTELPKYDEQGKEIEYTVDEEATDGYEKSIEGHDITNLRVGKTEVDITKLWKDEQETDRPGAITVNLLQ